MGKLRICKYVHYRVVITELGYLSCNLKADQSKYYVPVLGDTLLKSMVTFGDKEVDPF